jgi:acyl carrier protein
MDTLNAQTELEYPQLTPIFEDIFEHREPLTRETSPKHIQRWDSQQHIALVLQIETTFGVSLSMDEMMEMQSVHAIETILQRHGV